MKRCKEEKQIKKIYRIARLFQNIYKKNIKKSIQSIQDYGRDDIYY